MTDSALRELAGDPSSRKRFLKIVGGTGAVSTFAALLAACGDDEDTATTGAAASKSGSDEGGAKRDLEILNYALTLEYLEAEFYKQAVASGELKGAAVISLAKKFGQSEQEHVNALEATIRKLGGTPVAAPKTAFDEVIAQGQKAILATAATVENLGAAAYLGQANRISSKEVLAAALAIHSVEARHAAALNILVGRGFQGDGDLEGALPDGAFAKPMDMNAVLAAAKPFIAS